VLGALLGPSKICVHSCLSAVCFCAFCAFCLRQAYGATGFRGYTCFCLSFASLRKISLTGF
jgi:hypothetical protein